MNVERWSVWLANLDPVIGSEQGKTRPVLVMRQTALNQTLPVVNVLPNEALLPIQTANLTKESIVLCYQIRTLDKQRLVNKIGNLNAPILQEKITEALCFQLEILR